MLIASKDLLARSSPWWCPVMILAQIKRILSLGMLKYVIISCMSSIRLESKYILIKSKGSCGCGIDVHGVGLMTSK